jgi:hypothetical protein
MAISSRVVYKCGSDEAKSFKAGQGVGSVGKGTKVSLFQEAYIAPMIRRVMTITLKLLNT